MEKLYRYFDNIVELIIVIAVLIVILPVRLLDRIVYGRRS